MLLFALGASRAFGSSVASALGVSLSPHEERAFEDGEHKARPLVDVQGADVYVVQSLHGGPEQGSADKLVRLLLFLATLRDHGAARVSAVVPYLAYSRKDRRTQPHDPVASRYIAQLFESVGTDIVMTLEVHNRAAFENSFRCRTVHVDSHSLFDEVAMGCDDGESLVIASPDPGGVKRAVQWREALERRMGRPLGQAFLDKTRREGVVGGSTAVIGEVTGATVLVFDDILSSGTTMARAASALRAAGARRVFVFAAHGLFVADAAVVLRNAPIERIFVSDSVPPFRLPQDWIGSRVEVVAAAPLFAAAIRQQGATGPSADVQP